MKRLDNDGSTMIEYALIAALISVVAINAFRNVSNAIGGQSNSVSSKVCDALNDRPKAENEQVNPNQQQTS